MSEPLRVDVWSDVVCPWCYIGKRNLETGIRAFEEAEGSVPVVVEFHSFQLDPNTPDDFEGSAAEYLARHVGVDVETARQMQRQVSHVAAAVGLHYDFDSLKPANTLKAHQLLHLAKAHGLQLEVKEALMRAHFVEGRHVGRTEELVQIGAAAGLPAEETASSLERQEYLEAVRNDLELAARIGIRGVPFFVIDWRFGISGAQRPEVFTQTLQRAVSEPAEAP
jgi:predicted DsbA family dithiol-disulfide isomerase